jgi:hypothetical protein
LHIYLLAIALIEQGLELLQKKSLTILTYQGENVTLAPYLDGGYACINDGVTPHGVVKSVLDDGGPLALLRNGTDNGNLTSNQQ